MGEMERARAAVPEANLPPTYTQALVHCREIHPGPLLQPYIRGPSYSPVSWFPSYSPVSGPPLTALCRPFDDVNSLLKFMQFVHKGVSL